MSAKGWIGVDLDATLARELEAANARTEAEIERGRSWCTEFIAMRHDRDAARAEAQKLKEQLDERCMRLRAAESLAKKVDEAVEGGWLGSRTPIADARLSLSDPFTYPETDAEIARLRAQIAELAGDQPAS